MAVAASAPLNAQSVMDGIEAWQKADYAGAVAIWRGLANKGDADAAFNLGQAYRLGRGVAQDPAAAESWFERAARKGHVDAQATLGLLLFQTGNQTGGLRWLKMAARKGEPRAMLVYGTAMFNGDGLPRDPLLGYLYVTRAAETGLEPARVTLQRLDEILSPEDRGRALQLSLPKPEEEPPSAATSGKQATVRKPVKVAVAAPPARPAPNPAKPVALIGGGWMVQLGAFSKRSSAEALFQKLSSDDAMRGRHPSYVSVGTVTRLQVGPFASSAEAAAACRALSSRGQACFPVRSK